MERGGKAKSNKSGQLSRGTTPPQNRVSRMGRGRRNAAPTKTCENRSVRVPCVPFRRCCYTWKAPLFDIRPASRCKRKQKIKHEVESAKKQRPMQGETVQKGCTKKETNKTYVPTPIPRRSSPYSPVPS